MNVVAFGRQAGKQLGRFCCWLGELSSFKQMTKVGL